MPDLHPLVAALRDRRRALGLSQDAVAARSGLTQACVSRYESGQRTPGLHSVQAYAAAVGLRLELVPAETQAVTP